MVSVPVFQGKREKTICLKTLPHLICLCIFEGLILRGELHLHDIARVPDERNKRERVLAGILHLIVKHPSSTARYGCCRLAYERMPAMPSSGHTTGIYNDEDKER